MTSDSESALAEATTYYRDGAFDDALMLAETLLGEAPDWPAALLLRGKILFETGRKIDAAHTLRRVVTLDPDNAEAFYALGLTFRHLRMLDDAEGCLKAALRRNPDDDDARFVLANVLFALNKLDEAVTEYDALVTRRPADADVHFNLARAADDAGQAVRAMSAYRAVLTLAAQDAEAAVQRQIATERLKAWEAGVATPLSWDSEDSGPV